MLNIPQTDNETKLFNSFADRSRKKSRTQNRAVGSEDDTEELYNIDEEIEQLKEIKDIQDELHILSVLLENQTSVLEQATDALRAKADFIDVRAGSSSKSKSGPSKDSGIVTSDSQPTTYNFQKLHLLIQEQEKRRKGLQVQAEQANKAVGIQNAIRMNYAN